MTRKQIVILAKKHQLMPELYMFDEWIRKNSTEPITAISYMERFTKIVKRPVGFVIGTLTLLKDTIEYSKNTMQ